jgi:hypothetical protein
MESWRRVRARRCRTVRKSNELTHRSTRVVRRDEAVASEIPTPKSATYAATHAGHFGSRTSVTLGTIQLARPKHRRASLRGERSSWPFRRAGDGSLRKSPQANSWPQQRLIQAFKSPLIDGARMRSLTGDSWLSYWACLTDFPPLRRRTSERRQDTRLA